MSFSAVIVKGDIRALYLYMTKQWRITITVDKELYLHLEERAKKEARTLASLGKYFLLKGLESEKELTSTANEEDAA